MALQVSQGKVDEVKQILFTFLRELDSNNDGLIDREELFLLLTALGVISKDCAGPERLNSLDAVDIMLAGLDKNCDGVVELREFVDWVLFSAPDVHGKQLLTTKHIFLTPEDEARMERLTLFKLHSEENTDILSQAGLGDLMDPKRAFLSVGSSSTQVYDTTGLSVSVPTGTKVQNSEAMGALVSALKSTGVAYEQLMLINSIGYLLQPSDPVTLSLAELAAREPGGAAERFQAALGEAFPEAVLSVYNRSKDKAIKRYKFPQLLNDFSVALTRGTGLPEAVADLNPDIIVDWGGSSFKVFIGGKRVGTEVMDANELLCEGGVLHRDRLPGAIERIETYVTDILEEDKGEPSHKKVLIAQTGKARELALAEA